VTAVFDPIAVALKVRRVLDDLGIAHTIGGSIAASFPGEPRASIDIDIVAALDEPRIADFVSALGEEFYADEDALRGDILGIVRTQAHRLNRAYLAQHAPALEGRAVARARSPKRPLVERGKQIAEVAVHHQAGLSARGLRAPAAQEGQAR
jgi:hypothetical protein